MRDLVHMVHKHIYFTTSCKTIYDHEGFFSSCDKLFQVAFISLIHNYRGEFWAWSYVEFEELKFVNKCDTF